MESYSVPGLGAQQEGKHRPSLQDLQYIRNAGQIDGSNRGSAGHGEHREGPSSAVETGEGCLEERF